MGALVKLLVAVHLLGWVLAGGSEKPLYGSAGLAPSGAACALPGSVDEKAEEPMKTEITGNVSPVPFPIDVRVPKEIRTATFALG